jgi:hypothetical protein
MHYLINDEAQLDMSGNRFPAWPPIFNAPSTSAPAASSSERVLARFQSNGWLSLVANQVAARQMLNESSRYNTYCRLRLQSILAARDAPILRTGTTSDAALLGQNSLAPMSLAPT